MRGSPWQSSVGCWNCDYPVAGSQSGAPCPECGADTRRNTYLLRRCMVPTRAQRARFVALLKALLLRPLENLRSIKPAHASSRALVQLSTLSVMVPWIIFAIVVWLWCVASALFRQGLDALRVALLLSATAAFSTLLWIIGFVALTALVWAAASIVGPALGAVSVAQTRRSKAHWVALGAHLSVALAPAGISGVVGAAAWIVWTGVATDGLINSKAAIAAISGGLAITLGLTLFLQVWWLCLCAAGWAIGPSRISGLAPPPNS